MLNMDMIIFSMLPRDTFFWAMNSVWGDDLQNIRLYGRGLILKDSLKNRNILIYLFIECQSWQFCKSIGDKKKRRIEEGISQMGLYYTIDYNYVIKSI